MAKVPGAIVGAGTVLNDAQLDEAIDAGSQFIVSPGLTEPLAKAVLAVRQSPICPASRPPATSCAGSISASTGSNSFPAEASGGIAALKALSAPFGQVRFCPTGGIRADNAAEWLGLSSVLCVGGSWLYRGVEDSLEAVAERSRAAAALRI